MMSVPTYEDKLKRLIAAQVEGGYNKWKSVGLNLPAWLFWDGDGEANESLLRVLLDTEGAKAVYGETKDSWCSECGQAVVFEEPPQGWHGATHKILDAWHSGEGNQWKDAIDTAYSLLNDE